MRYRRFQIPYFETVLTLAPSFVWNFFSADFSVLKTLQSFCRHKIHFAKTIPSKLSDVKPLFRFKNLDLPRTRKRDLRRDSRRSRFAGVRERRLCRSVVFNRSTGVVECWSIVQDSVFDGGTRVPQNCHG